MDKEKICSLYIDFSFLPQVIGSASIFWQIRFDSAVLLDKSLRSALYANFLEIAVFAFLTIPKRFRITRILLIAAYIQLPVTVRIFKFTWIARYVNMNGYLYGFCLIGIILAALNLAALIRLRKEVQ